jgi:hypothetical protein
MRGASGEKLDRLQHICRLREAFISQVNVTQDLEQKARLRATPPSGEAPLPTRVVGLVSDRDGPIGTSQIFHATSHWAGSVDGRWYLVYAGAAATPGSNRNTQAELRVYREPTELNSGEPNVFVGSY